MFLSMFFVLYIYIYIYIYITQLSGAVEFTDCIPEYNTKPSDDEALVLELSGM